MILSFRNKETEKVFSNEASKVYPADIQRTALRKLVQIHAAVSLGSLRVPPGNRLEALKGDRVGQHSLRINDQWRVCRRARVTWRSWIITEGRKKRFMERVERLPNIHPGEVLGEDFLKPLGLSAAQLARDIGIGRARVSQIVRGVRDVTPDTAIRLGLYFGTEPEFWLNLQAHYNLVQARHANADQYRDIPRHARPERAA